MNVHEWSITGAFRRALSTATLAIAVTACSGGETLQIPESALPPPSTSYQIGPGDVLQVVVYENQDITAVVPVRPDGRVTIPLVEDVEAAGKTPTQLARELEEKLKTYVREPVVTVIVTEFVGTFGQQVRVVGAAQKPKALPYRDKMTLLDVMIAVDGLTDFAAGNRAKIIRAADGSQKQYGVKLDDLVREGDIKANVSVLPGDIIIIPQSYF